MIRKSIDKLNQIGYNINTEIEASGFEYTIFNRIYDFQNNYLLKLILFIISGDNGC